jgi:plastocyanin
MARRILVLGIGLLGFAAAACGGGAGSPAPAPGTPSAVGSGAFVALTITAKDIAYTPASMSAPAGAELRIRFDNQDSGVPHNIALFGDAGFSTMLFEGEIITGPATRDATIPGLIAGTYQFRCTVHPNMTAELKVGG